ncbi:MAG: ASKHA domain-containing protein [Lachnospiraceae bacterium]|nr:ASKHA domain-containing protein [Lachnospiraceae bacterium]
MTVLEYLRQNNTEISSICGGRGTCGKCLVSIDGNEPVLACKSEYREGMDIKVLSSDEGMEIQQIDEEETSPDQAEEHAIAIDIGTTTIAAVMCGRKTGNIVAKTSVLNSGRSFGADVISRIQAGNEGKLGEMTAKLREDLRGVIFELIKKTDITKIGIITIAGNTTMVHTLMGYELSPLGSFPYEPVHSELIDSDAGFIIGLKENFIKSTRCVVLPGISAFVGGDIVSGLYYLMGIHGKLFRGGMYTRLNNESLEKRGDIEIYGLMDIGTNGEIALIKEDDIYAASTAAGPVFEGGAISCGLGSVPGAIDHISIGADARISFSLIGEQGGRPATVKGLCGSGVVDCASELVRTGLCDSHGTFCDVPGYGSLNINAHGLRLARRIDGSYVNFTQEDMRQLQMAKAAISAGFETLCDNAGITVNRLSALYLAGGMGTGVSTHSARRIGLVPDMPEEKIIAAGNLSLKGAVSMITGDIERNTETLLQLVNRCKVIDLASDKDFENRYIHNMDFTS